MVVMSIEEYESQQAFIELCSKLSEAEAEIANGAAGEDFFEVARDMRLKIHGQKGN
jgi:predicted HAD superfamily phosphohydrolase